jgi:hypothetical protein
MSEIDEDLMRYLAGRDELHAREISAALDRLTDRERTLVREAGVMGYVRGMLRVPGGFKVAVPRDSAIVADVVGACIAMNDRFPLIAGRPAEEPTDAE